jgi:predicted ester cyclase
MFMQRHRSTLPTFLLALIPFQTSAQTPKTNLGASMSDNAAVVHRLYEQCLNHDRLDLLPELVSPNVINHTYAGDKIGLADFTQGIETLRRSLSSQHFTLEGVVANDNQAAAHWTMTAINSGPLAGLPATNKAITQHGVVFYRFENSKIAEVWLQVDRLGVFQQIGAPVPGNTPPALQAR